MKTEQVHQRQPQFCVRLFVKMYSGSKRGAGKNYGLLEDISGYYTWESWSLLSGVLDYRCHKLAVLNSRPQHLWYGSLDKYSFFFALNR